MKINPFVKIARRSAFTLTGLALAASTGLVMTAAPSQAATDSSDSDFNFTVVAKDLAYGEASFSVEERQRLLVNGTSTQLSWWNPDHNVKVTKKSLRKAPRIKVVYKACSVQSKSIAKQAQGASIVIAKPGSVICNTGKNGNIVGGFKWTVTKGPAVLKWNKNLKLYEHVFNLIKPSALQPGDEVVGHVTIGGVRYAIVKVCKNRMGGRVDVMYPSVVQVRYEQDVQESGKAVAKAAVGGTVTFSITCPNGANFNTTVTTSAEANASASILFTERTRVSALDAKKVELRHDLKVDGDADALAKAETKIEVSGTCGDNPPPPPPPPPADNLPSMQCHAAQHIWVGEDPMVAVFDLTDPDGTPVSFDRLEVSGPIEIVLTEDTTITGGKRRTLTIRAAHIPEGTEQPYSLKLFGSSGGKQTSCLAQGTVKNNDTGWEA